MKWTTSCAAQAHAAVAEETITTLCTTKGQGTPTAAQRNEKEFVSLFSLFALVRSLTFHCFSCLLFSSLSLLVSCGNRFVAPLRSQGNSSPSSRPFYSLIIQPLLFDLEQEYMSLYSDAYCTFVSVNMERVSPAPSLLMVQDKALDFRPPAGSLSHIDLP
uniref:Secreted protein n=1 Tax=Heterorhabditis bacteriophora TaxID=37862 RepID=A0A1I7WQH4_HETBA